MPETTPIGPFASRHIGPREDDIQTMLAAIGQPSLEALIDSAVPASIRSHRLPKVDGPLSEVDALARIRRAADLNEVYTSYIGLGYYGTLTPAVIQRNVLENPGWYTSYTPYQPEISQGRLEALLNFQTAVSDLTGLEIANSSLLDEGTAAAEAMTLIKRVGRSKNMVFFVDEETHPNTIDVIRTRATPLGFYVTVGDPEIDLDPSTVFGVLLQYPGTTGKVRNIAPIIAQCHEAGALVAVATDLMASTLLTPVGELGADVAIGSSQRFGVPLMFGGPHAAFMATRDKYKRSMPGRLVGVSVDAAGRSCLRLTLQTREQHIRRDRATSNICTAQVLLAVMAGLYATYHGPARITEIARQINDRTNELAARLVEGGFMLVNDTWFDTLTVKVDDADALLAKARERRVNLRQVDGTTVGVSLDETTTDDDVDLLSEIFDVGRAVDRDRTSGIPAILERSSEFMTHPVFHRYHSETEMMRYLRRLQGKDIALDRSMIPLGSCTMKLNAASEMIPITWPEFTDIHPFVPLEQAAGYLEIIQDIEKWLATISGYDAVSVQPNSGAQGEFTGLLAIRGYHEANGDSHRDICLIPSSAHGTNPASAVMAGMKVVVVNSDEDGSIDVADLKVKAEEHAENLAAIMVTYPSTHGVFEEAIVEICDIVHQNGGQVYLDGANMNAMVGIAEPGLFGSDVSHFNLHKTFAIPHGGGGPGVGPIGVMSHLEPFLPGHSLVPGLAGGGPVTSAPWGSAGVLAISWMYMVMLGPLGLQRATEVAILNANYIAKRLAPHYPVLYTGPGGLVAHECIIDIRDIDHDFGINNEDVAKRLIDFGFHAPTMSFPVAGTLMIEPTESESLYEIDRFIDAMIAIKGEIDQVASGEVSAEDSVLRSSPHTAEDLLVTDWSHPYTREAAAYPVPALREWKYWVPVGRVDNAYGDRNVMCACPPVEDYA